MEDNQIIGIIGQGGIAGALILVIYKIGSKLVEVIEKLGTKVDDHTTKDLAAMSAVREDLAALDAKIDVIADLTPIRGVRQTRAASQPGAQAGYYSPRKPPREDE